MGKERLCLLSLLGFSNSSRSLPSLNAVSRCHRLSPRHPAARHEDLDTADEDGLPSKCQATLATQGYCTVCVRYSCAWQPVQHRMLGATLSRVVSSLTRLPHISTLSFNALSMLPLAPMSCQSNFLHLLRLFGTAAVSPVQRDAQSIQAWHAPPKRINYMNLLWKLTVPSKFHILVQGIDMLELTCYSALDSQTVWFCHCPSRSCRFSRSNALCFRHFSWLLRLAATPKSGSWLAPIQATFNILKALVFSKWEQATGTWGFQLDSCPQRRRILSTPKNSCLSESKTSSQVGVLNGKMCFLEKNSITQYSYSTVELRAFIRRRDRIDRAKQRIGVCNSSLQHGRPFECMSCLNNSGPAVEHGTTNESQ